MRDRRLYGHRGSSADLPENTIPAFRSALNDGATALELDVHVTRDGQVVVAHDPDGSRRAGVNRLIANCTLPEVRDWKVGVHPDGSPARVPLLTELLDEFPIARLNVDIKPAGIDAVSATLKTIRERDAEERVTLASFHNATMAAVRAAGYRGEKSLPPGEVLRLRFYPTAVLRMRPPRGDAVQIPRGQWGIKLDSPKFIERCHSFGLRVDYWVINDEAEARVLLEAGADGIVSDAPGVVAGALFGAGAVQR